ncbi:MAG: hypothetical protein BAJALOKI1v1_30029 [Promethearchaeota archaeon]|nr:MAG: hypothetical protein BAJALOKI1v1_30029 [Candidatus Lokiarchaeota archaeon]
MNVNLIKTLFIPRYIMSEGIFKQLHHFSKKTIKKRLCWACGIPLNFWDFCSSFREDELEKMIKLWQSKYVEFYCCACFNLKKVVRKKLPAATQTS